MCQHRGRRGSPFMLSEQKRLREYFSPCEIAGKELCFSVGLFSADLKQTALFLHELNGHFKKYEWDLKVNDAVWCGDSLLSWQQSCGPVCPEQRDNSGASRGLRKTACRRNAPLSLNQAHMTGEQNEMLEFKISLRWQIQNIPLFGLISACCCLPYCRSVDTQQVLLPAPPPPILPVYCRLLFLEILLGLNDLTASWVEWLNSKQPNLILTDIIYESLKWSKGSSQNSEVLEAYSDILA